MVANSLDDEYYIGRSPEETEELARILRLLYHGAESDEGPDADENPPSRPPSEKHAEKKTETPAYPLRSPRAAPVGPRVRRSGPQHETAAVLRPSWMTQLRACFLGVLSSQSGQAVTVQWRYEGHKASPQRQGTLVSCYAHGCLIDIQAAGWSHWRTFVSWIDLWVGHVRFVDDPMAALIGQVRQQMAVIVC